MKRPSSTFHRPLTLASDSVRHDGDEHDRAHSGRAASRRGPAPRVARRPTKEWARVAKGRQLKIRRALSVLTVVAGVTLATAAAMGSPATEQATTCGVPEFVGHRGAPTLAPENTVRSMRIAAAAGTAIVEADVRFTKDGVPILMHDPTLDRTTNGTGAVKDRTWSYISKLKTLGPTKSKVSNLDQYLSALEGVSPRFKLNVKKPGATRAMVDELFQGVIAHGLQGRFIFNSTAAWDLKYAHNKYPWVYSAFVTPDLSFDVAEFARETGNQSYAVNFKWLTNHPNTVTRVHDAGLDLVTFVVDQPGKWNRASKLDVDGITTNRVADGYAWRGYKCRIKKVGPADRLGGG